MKTKKLLRNPLILVASAMFWSSLNLHAQSAPTITNQLVDQVVTNGGTVMFSVAVDGTGPFSYQWQFNGKNIAPFITTVAGNGNFVYSGDGGAATNTSVGFPAGVAFDPSGKLFIADSYNDRIRKVDTNGIITTVAGNGSAGYSGDGGAATNASLNNPGDVAFDAFGNLFITDGGNGRIRKVDTNGIITTVAGNGNSGYSGDGGVATNTSLSGPNGIACDPSGNLYIADTDNFRVRKVDTNGIITTVAGNGSAGYSADGGAATNASIYVPYVLAFDASGNLYIADYLHYRIRMVNTNGIIFTVAGNGSYGYSGDGGAATNASLEYSSGIAVDSAGNLYIADVYNSRIRKVDTNGIISTVVGNGTNSYSGDGNLASNAALYDPLGMTVDSAGNLYIADEFNERIRKVYAWPSNLSTLTLASITTNNIGNYSVIVSSSAGSVTSSVAVLYMPPFITTQPATQLAVVGSSPSFSVATAGSGPFGYEWYFAGTNLVQGGTNSTLTLPNVSTNNAGNYIVVVTNCCGSVTSAVVSLLVGFPPTITAQPSNQTNLAGTTASFSVGVNGTGPFTYQWQFNGTNFPNNIITTVAGKSSSGYSGDNGAATNASLYSPEGVVFDASGNLFIADSSNYRIRKVDTNGVITTVAGNGSATYSGDGVAATNASLNLPSGIAFDASGNLFIADYNNNRIRKVDTNGIITTVAGNGILGHSGDGGAATNANLHFPSGVAFDASGNLYIVDYDNKRIRKVDTNGIITTVAGNGNSGYSGDGGAATNANLYLPFSMAFDAFGNLFIADYGNNRIRKVDTNGTITTVAGGGSANPGDGDAATNAIINSPYGVSCDAFGNLYIAGGGRIRKVDTNGLIATVAGGGSANPGDGGAATSAKLYSPKGVTFDASGNLFIADSSNNRIRKVLLYAGYPTFTLNNMGATNAGNYTVVITSPYGSVTSAVMTLTVEAPPVITIQPPSQIVLSGSSPSFSVAVAGSGPFDYEWYFAGTNLVQSGTNCTLTLSNVSTNNAGNYTVVVTNNYGSVTSQVATLMVEFLPITTQPASQTNLAGTSVSFNVAVNGTGPFTYQWQFNGTNLPNNIITTVAGNGIATYAGDDSAATNASLNRPSGVAFDASGNLYIADYYNNCIRKVDTNGIITTVAGNSSFGYSGDGGAATNASLSYPDGLAFDASCNMYIADQSNNRIRKVDTNGIMTTVVGNGSFSYSGDGGAATNSSMRYPSGVAFDAAGNLFIADHNNDRIRKVDTNGIIITVAGNGYNTPYNGGYSGDGGAATNAELFYPSSVAVDATGNLFIADFWNSRIRKVDTNGIITTIAGKSASGYSGDGGTATNASLNLPSGVAFDPFGNLYISDEDNNRIRKVDTNGIITTVAGNGTNSYSGDGGAATNASLYYPSGVAIDAFGNLFIADTDNNRIRKVFLYAGYPTFTLNNVGPTNAGNYTVVITGPYGSVTSAVVTLTVVPAIITTQPASQIALAGSSPSFSVAATGSGPLDYEWYFAGTNLLQIGTNSTLTLPNVSISNAGNYLVVVTNSYGSVTSQIATLLVGFSPTVTTQPASQTNLAGTNVSFNVAVNGTGPFTYQWQINGTNLPNGIITTVAGNGTATYAGDHGLATYASLYYPRAVAFDTSGSLFIADYNNNRIRKVDTNGIITTVAGKSSYGYAGDGGTATNASLAHPSGVAFDVCGNLFIADYNNNRIRKVDTNGIITTVAGNGSIDTYTNSQYVYGFGDGGAATNANLYYPSGVAFDAYGNLFIADTDNSRIRKVATNGIITTVAGNGTNSYSGDGGAATNTGLYYPSGVAFDSSGNLLIADSSNNRIRKVDTNGIITTVAGNGSSGYSGDGSVATNANLSSPSGVTFDASGNLYIADRSNERIRKVDTSGFISTVAGNGSIRYSGDGGAATNAKLWIPSGVAFDASGNLYIADYDNDRIRKVLLYAGNSTFTLNNIGAINAGNYTVVITSPYGSVTSAVVTLTLPIPPVIISQPTSQITAVGSSPSFSVAVAGSGPFGYQWYFLNTNLQTCAGAIAQTIYSFTVAAIVTNGGSGYTTVPQVYVVGGGGNGAGGVATVSNGMVVAITMTNAGSGYASPPLIQIDPPNGLLIGQTGPLLNLNAVTTNNAGNYFVTITNNYGSVTGQIATLTAALPPSLTIQPTSQTNLAGTTVNFSVASSGIGPFTYQWQFNGTNLPSNFITTVAGTNYNQGYSGDGGAATNASLNNPYGLAFDAVGNLFIADRINYRIRKVDTNDIITTVAGNGSVGDSGDGGAATNASLNNPIGLAFDTVGDLYIADRNGRIRMVNTNGIIISVAGGGSANLGDGGAATNANLGQLFGVAVDASGNIYLGDGNNRIRKVDTNGFITTVAGGGSSYPGNGGAATNASLNGNTAALAFDTFGNLYIADSGNNRICKVDTSGIITAVAGNGSASYAGDGGAATNASLNSPWGVAFDATGNLYISDRYNYRVRMVATNGTITTVAGNGTNSYSGDGGTATNASIGPSGCGVAFDVSGNLYITDDAPYGNRIRKVWFAGNPTFTLNNIEATNAGNYTVVVTSPYGSVTSAVASLTITIQPQIITSGANFGFVGNQFGFNISGTSDQTIVVDSSTNLVDWIPLYTNTAGGTSYFNDPNWTNYPGRFYRLRSP